MSSGDRFPLPDTLSVSSRQTRVAGLVLALLIVAVYLPSFRGTWVYDDIQSVLENPTLRQVGSAWRPPAEGGLPVGGRPIVNLSLAINYAISGNAIWSYHAANLVIHVATALLLFGLLRRTLETDKAREVMRASRWPDPADALCLAAGISLLWAVHPLDTEAVVYIVQRAESLMACWYLLVLYAFTRAVSGGTHRGTNGWLALSVGASAIGMATKEAMVSAPIIVLLYDRTFIGRTFAEAWRRRREYYLALASTWLILVLLVVTNSTRGGTAGFAVKATWWSYAAAQLHAHLLYLQLTLWPDPLIFDYGLDALPYPHGTLVAGLILGAWVGAILIAMWRNSVLGFTGAVYFAILAPSSSVVPIVTEPIAEHRMYLPLAAILAAIVLPLGRWRWLWRSIVAMAVIVCATITIQRMEVYRSAQALWGDTVAKCPINARAHFNLAKVLFETGNEEGALEHFSRALAIRPDFPSAHHGLSEVYRRKGDIVRSRHHAEEALRINPKFAAAHNDLANALLLSGDAQNALAEYQTAVRLEPNDADMRHNLAVALARLNRLPEARAEYLAALTLSPKSALLHFSLGNVLVKMGDFERAIEEYEIVMRIDSKYPRAVENLALVRGLRDQMRMGK